MICWGFPTRRSQGRKCGSTPIEYVKRNFRYSILENFNARVDDAVILKRESYWKSVLDTRTHGYNGN